MQRAADALDLASQAPAAAVAHPVDESNWVSIPKEVLQQLRDSLAERVIAHPVAAEVDAGPWAVTETGNVQSNDFEHDVKLGISGDFASKEERLAYGRWLVDTLNKAAKRDTAPASVQQEATAWMVPGNPPVFTTSRQMGLALCDSDDELVPLVPLNVKVKS